MINDNDEKLIYEFSKGFQRRLLFVNYSFLGRSLLQLLIFNYICKHNCNMVVSHPKH